MVGCDRPGRDGSRQTALSAGLLDQFFQFRHRLFDGPMVRLFVPDGCDPLDVARAHAHISDLRALQFQDSLMSSSSDWIGVVAATENSFTRIASLRQGLGSFSQQRTRPPSVIFLPD